jgi:hypothetical protein
MPAVPYIVWIAIAAVVLLLGDDFADKAFGPTPMVDSAISPDLQLMIFGIALAMIIGYVVLNKSK